MKTVAQSAVLVGLAALLVEGAPQLFPRELVERPRMVARDVYTVCNDERCLLNSCG